MRGCPYNVFRTSPHSYTIVIIVTSVCLQLLVLLIQSIPHPVRYLPRPMRRRIRHMIRRRRQRLSSEGTYTYFKKFENEHEHNETGTAS
jgi:hypothetical protein